MQHAPMSVADLFKLPRGTNKQGYVLRYLPKGRWRYKTAPWVLEHRAVVEAHLGRPLRRDETVHHRNHVKTDNRIENLEVLTRSEHGKEHHPLLGETRACAICDKLFYCSPFNVRRDRKTCSSVCGAQLPGARKNQARNLTGRTVTTTSKKTTRKIIRLRELGRTWKQVSDEMGMSIPACRDRHMVGTGVRMRKWVKDPGSGKYVDISRRQTNGD